MLDRLKSLFGGNAKGPIDIDDAALDTDRAATLPRVRTLAADPDFRVSGAAARIVGR